MPQIDRYKKRTVNIDFYAIEDFKALPYQNQFTIVFVTSGSIKGMLNNRPIAISAPGVLCLSEVDVIQVLKKKMYQHNRLVLIRIFLIQYRFQKQKIIFCPI